ncbi:hypothetical protein NA57DRAFT_70967 [Rhizodiscina lignyota]|uniref:Uncharacterized protein n=1 Tax=Rhizodiscina lignyota TaxID=1504668 RepID=A0A9P4ISV0_9PEZI|nr:hypothetical protein NA57DRAFT_70967 [Rhizodiscina lignyota]
MSALLAMIAPSPATVAAAQGLATNNSLLRGLEAAMRKVFIATFADHSFAPLLLKQLNRIQTDPPTNELEELTRMLALTHKILENLEDAVYKVAVAKFMDEPFARALMKDLGHGRNVNNDPDIVGLIQSLAIDDTS